MRSCCSVGAVGFGSRSNRNHVSPPPATSRPTKAGVSHQGSPEGPGDRVDAMGIGKSPRVRLMLMTNERPEWIAGTPQHVPTPFPTSVHTVPPVTMLVGAQGSVRPSTQVQAG